MDRVELSVVTLTHSVSSNNSYAVVLKEKEDERRLPIIIGSFEAQAIAIALEEMPTGRPLTHDLFKNVFEEISIQLNSVFIKELKDGIFYSVLECEKDGKEYNIDARTSDSIALAVRFGCPIYTTEAILKVAGMFEELTLEEETDEEELASQPQSLDDLSLRKLEKLMKESIAKEDYEQAARIRDAIQRKKS